MEFHHQRLLQRTVLVAHMAILGPTVEVRTLIFGCTSKREGEFVDQTSSTKKSAVHPFATRTVANCTVSSNGNRCHTRDVATRKQKGGHPRWCFIW